MKNLIKLLLVYQQESFLNFYGLADSAQTWTLLPITYLTFYYFQAPRASMIQQFSAKTFSLNLFHTLTYPFLILFSPKRKLPFMKNVWFGIYHYGNHSFAVVSFPLKHTFHLKACRLSQGQHFQIHYYFAQTVISTGNLHLAVVCLPWE